MTTITKTYSKYHAVTFWKWLRPCTSKWKKISNY